jgi:hypothetical protein
MVHICLSDMNSDLAGQENNFLHLRAQGSLLC